MRHLNRYKYIIALIGKNYPHNQGAAKSIFTRNFIFGIIIPLIFFCLYVFSLLPVTLPGSSLIFIMPSFSVFAVILVIWSLSYKKKIINGILIATQAIDEIIKEVNYNQETTFLALAQKGGFNVYQIEKIIRKLMKNGYFNDYEIINKKIVAMEQRQLEKPSKINKGFSGGKCPYCGAPLQDVKCNYCGNTSKN